jgi:hypothetical protein
MMHHLPEHAIGQQGSSELHNRENGEHDELELHRAEKDIDAYSSSAAGTVK